MKIAFALLMVLSISYSCTTLKKSDKAVNVSALRFINEYDVPHRKTFKGTTIGGLSGIDRDKKTNRYYIISDDRSAINPARYYTSKFFVSAKGIDSVQFVDVHFLTNAAGKTYPNSKEDPAHTPDPESIRYNPKRNELVWSSEGERIIRTSGTILEDPAITIASANGAYKDTFVLPSNMHMQAMPKGPRQNGVFEGITFADNYKTLYVNVEEPLYDDGPRAGLNDTTGWIRMIKFDVASRKPMAQYAYKIDPVAYPATPASAFKINGVPDILWLGNNKLLVTERSFSTGRPGCVIRVYLADLDGATDVSHVPSIPAANAVQPISKKLLLDMDKLGIYIDNIEGATFGPDLTDGHHTILFVSDDNFEPYEKTQFLLFEIE